MNGFKRLLNGICGLLFPCRCLLCGEPLASTPSKVCTPCREGLSMERDCRCPVCGKTADRCVCGVPYLKEEVFPDVRWAVSFFYSSDSHAGTPVLTRTVILRCKKTCMPELVRITAQAIGFRVKEILEENHENIEDWIVTYPPRNGENLLKYGFDHGEMLAEALAELLGIPCRKTLIRVSGKVQKTLDGGERYENIKDGFAVIGSGMAAGGKYLLVDDVITTGATMQTARELLLDHGAAAVLPAAAAKTMPKNADRRNKV